MGYADTKVDPAVIQTPSKVPKVGTDTGDPVTGDYKAKFDFSGGRVIKVIYKIVNDAHVNVERAMAAKMARD